MIDFDKLFLEKVVIHQVGNKVRNEGYQISEKFVSIEDNNLKMILEKYFLQLFVDKDTYNFHHDSEISLNEVYHFTKLVFENSASFYEQSVNIVKHLYNSSDHPNIKSGDFYMVYFTDESNTVKVAGIFKAENKDTFLKVDKDGGSFSFSYEKGLNLNKIDKGCLVISSDYDTNYEVLIIDSSAKTDKSIAKYWEINFLNVRRHQNIEFKTKELLKINDEFSKKILEVELKKKPEKVLEFKKKTYEYINENREFDNKEFLEKVLPSIEDKKKYTEFKQKYEEKHELQPMERFEVSKSALQKSKQNIVSKMRLDTGVDLRITNFEYLEEGYDNDTGMSFVKIFFNSKK
jgi:hypothetical protein